MLRIKVLEDVYLQVVSHDISIDEQKLFIVMYSFIFINEKIPLRCEFLSCNTYHFEDKTPNYHFESYMNYISTNKSIKKRLKTLTLFKLLNMM